MTTTTAPEWDLADRIRKARRHADLTQAELAAAIGVSTSRLGNWESGSAHPRDVVATARAIAEATQVPVEWLLDLGTGPAARSRCGAQLEFELVAA